MNTISFMTANYVARPLGYQMTEGWGQGDQATQDYFRSMTTFATRFNEYLHDIKMLGFEAFDLWVAILNPTWATGEHVAVVKELVLRNRLRITSLAGWFGASSIEFEAFCTLAHDLTVPVLAGNTDILLTDRKAMIEMLERYDLRLGVENHPEKTPEELLEKIGSGDDGRIGAAVDTGWFGTHGYDASAALDKLQNHLIAVHLKDIRQAGGHDTCRYGQGCVPIASCVKVLKKTGYAGTITIEHEPDSFDPTEDVAASFTMLKQWLS